MRVFHRRWLSSFNEPVDEEYGEGEARRRRHGEGAVVRRVRPADAEPLVDVFPGGSGVAWESGPGVPTGHMLLESAGRAWYSADDRTTRMFRSWDFEWYNFVADGT